MIDLDGNSWKYEVSDFGNGYVLYLPNGRYLRDDRGAPILFPTIETMRRTIRERTSDGRPWAFTTEEKAIVRA